MFLTLPADLLVVFLPASSAQALHPSGAYLLTAAKNGKLSRWQLQPPTYAVAATGDNGSSSPTVNNGAAVAGRAAAASGGGVRSGQLQLESNITKCVVDWPALDGSSIDCMSFLTGDWGPSGIAHWKGGRDVQTNKWGPIILQDLF